MKLVKIARHYGVSFNKGSVLTHLWIKDVVTKELFARWDRFFIANGLARNLIKSEGGITNLTHFHSEVYPFISLDLIKEILEKNRLSAKDILAYEKLLANVGFEASNYSETYKKYFDVALKKGWVAIPDMFGSVFVTLFGAGKFAQLMMMNNHESVHGILTYAGIDKMFCKSLLTAFGINSPKAALATTGEEAATVAAHIGYPVVVKTRYGANSAGVITGIMGKKECLGASKKLLTVSRNIIVEKMISGIEYRLHFINGRLATVFTACPLYVVGDGKRCLAALIKDRHEHYYQTIVNYKFHQDILVCLLWKYRVRRFSDITTFVPRNSQKIIVSSSTGRSIMKEVSKTAISKADIKIFERMFERYGSPSAGIDLILKNAGSRINDGGGVLEINLPCGIIYLKDLEKVIGKELANTLNRRAGFLKNRGRVPVWVAIKGRLRALKLKFKEKYPNGQIVELSAGAGWFQILYSANAEAFLISIDEEAVLQHGMPINLKPTLFFTGDRNVLMKENYIITETVKNAGGKFVKFRDCPGQAAITKPSK